MGLSKISKLKIPIIIPKRNKGHHEVMCECNAEINSVDLKDVTNIVGYFVPLIKNTCFMNTPLEVGSSIVKKEKLASLHLLFEFFYHLDRASATYKNSFYEMYCFYDVYISKKSTSFEMGIKIPIRIKDIFPISGQLSFSIIKPKDIYFEDILDYVQKYVDLKLYPSVSIEDEKNLTSMIDSGKTVTDYINILSSDKEFGKIGEGIRIEIKHPDIYNTYEEFYSISKER